MNGVKLSLYQRDITDEIDFDSFEVQPLIMKLLHRVYETRLKEIKEVHGVNIIWEENANLVQICPATTVSETYHKGSEEFINLYQEWYSKMRREEIELELSDSRELATEDIRNLEAENNVVMEVKENKLVVYAEETNISVAVQALKKTLGLLPGNRKGTRRGLRNTKSRSFQNTPPAQVLSHKLSHNGSMTVPNRNCDGSTEESLSGGKQPQNDENTHTHRPEDEQRDAEMDMEVEQSISDEKQNDVTQPQNALASGQSLDISGRQTIQERQDPGGGDIHASGRHAGPGKQTTILNKILNVS